MRSSINFFIILLALLICTQIAGSQNVTVQLIPHNPPIQIPAPGASFDYDFTIRNTGTVPQTFSVWIMVRLPNQSWYGPVAGPTSLTLPGGAAITRQRSQAIPANAPAGNYVYEGRVGIYPNTIWSADSFSFAKTLEGSQLWEAHHNGAAIGHDRTYTQALAVDSVGNAYVTGESYESGNWADFVTIKYDVLGLQLWERRYNGPGNGPDEAYALALDGEGNVYVTGISNGTESSDYCTIKYAHDGSRLWVARYCYPGAIFNRPQALVIDPNGYVIVTGWFVWSSVLDGGYLTVKYDFSGNLVWAAIYEGPGGLTCGKAVTVDTDGNVLVTGGSVGVGTADDDILTVKYDRDGQQLWEARYNGPGDGTDRGWSIAVDASGNVYVAGRCYIGPWTQYENAILKYDSNGNLLWERRFRSPWIDEIIPGPRLALDSVGNVYAVAPSFAPWGVPDNMNVTTAKYDSEGNQVWTVAYNNGGGGVDMYSGYTLALDADGNVYITGDIHDELTDGNYLTIKYNGNGNLAWAMRYNGQANSWDNGTSLALDPSGNVYVTGYSNVTQGDEEIVTLKYSAGNLANWQPAEALIFGAQESVTDYAMYPNHPNPFNPTTGLSFELRVSSLVNLSIYDISGRLVTTLVNGWRDAGSHQVTFDGLGVPSGVYLCKLQAGEYTGVQKLVLLK